MKTKTSMFRPALAVTSALAALLSTVSAQTNFTGASTDFISDATKWSGGALPSSGNTGTLANDARFDPTTNFTHTGYVVVHSGGNLTSTGTGPLILSGGSWTMNGTATYSGRGLDLRNSNFYTVNVGSGNTANYSANERDILIASSSTMLVTSGNILGGRSLGVGSGGTFTMNSTGTVSFATTAYFGSSPLSSTASTINLNAGTITADRFALRAATTVNFGGSTAGSATFADWGTGLYTTTGDRAQDNNFILDFNPTTLMTLTLSSNARALDFTNDSISNPTSLAWAEALWGRNQLLYGGQSATTLGLSWATVTSTGFGDGKYFDFDALGTYGGSLRLAAIPEPSSIALVALGMTGLLYRRRRA